MKKCWITLFLVFLFVFVLSSCQSSVNNTESIPNEVNVETPIPEISNPIPSVEEDIIEQAKDETEAQASEQPDSIETEPVLNEVNTELEEILSVPMPLEQLQDLEVHFIDVGQADCILVKLPNGQIMQIDGGNRSDSKIVLDYLAKEKITSIDYLVATHPHEDHIGGLPDIIDLLDIRSIYMPKVSANTQIFEKLLTSIQNKELTVNTAKAGVSIMSTPDLQLDIVAPVKSDYKNLNDYSAIIKLTYKSVTFLFTGDAEATSESQITANISADVLKVGHHGSDTSTSDAFLNKVDPTYAIISVGKDNSYGHPSDSVLAKLNNANINVFRTDIDSTTIITSNGNEIKVNKEPTPYSPNAPPASVIESTPAPTATPNDTPSVSESKSVTVYVTKTGAKYHSDGCRYLSKSKIAMSLDDAKKKYDPCSVCNPPR